MTTNLKATAGVVVKRILAGLAVGLGLLGAATAQAGQNEPAAEVQFHAHHYYVYYRCHHGDWELYGCYDCPVEARHVAWRLEDRGYVTRVTCKY